jgi:hypothetical protein
MNDEVRTTCFHFIVHRSSFVEKFSLPCGARDTMRAAQRLLLFVQPVYPATKAISS